MIPKILVVGSSNTDMVIKTKQIPAPGETVLGGVFFMNAGGKGANQAVAAARLGGNVIFIAKTGSDIFGREALNLFKKENIDTRFVFTDPKSPSGVALITVDDHGENCIVVAPGANGTLDIDNIQQAKKAIQEADIILLQLEIPIQTVEHVAALAGEKKIRVILNPAPACMLPDSLLACITVITPNEAEAEKLTGVRVSDPRSAATAAEKLCAKGVETVIVTLGDAGVLLYHQNKATHIPGYPVKAVDTTAAGDVFNGAFVVALSEKKDLAAACDFACKAASLSVTRLGALDSAPFREEVDSAYSIYY
jgi:ribokinase